MPDKIEEALHNIDDASTEMQKANAKLKETEYEEKANELTEELTKLFNKIYEDQN